MSGPSPNAVGVARRIHRLSRVGIGLIGIGLVFNFCGLPRAAFLVTCLNLLLQIFSMEALGTLSLSFREHLK